MKPESQKIAIAEACGWHSIRMVPASDGLATAMWGMGPAFKKTNLPTNLVPDYLNDLNAMNEAEKVLTDPQKSVYRIHLYDVANCANYENYKADFSLLHATAAQRAEAFLRTIGKWRDDA